MKYKGGIQMNKLENKEFQYTLLENGTIELTKYIGNKTELELPQYIDNHLVTSIGSLAFEETPVQRLVIPKNIVNIHSQAFCICRKLEDIIVNDDNEHFSSLNGILYSKDQTSLICYPNGKTDFNFIIPDSVKIIESCAVSCNRYLYCVYIPDGVKEIKDFAFGTSFMLKEVWIPASVEKIGKDAFAGCEMDDIVGMFIGVYIDEPTFVVLCVYEDTIAMEYAIANKLHYSILDENEQFQGVITGIEALQKMLNS